MLTFLNSKSLWIGTDLKRFNQIRDALDAAHIVYKIKTKDQMGQQTARIAGQVSRAFDLNLNRGKEEYMADHKKQNETVDEGLRGNEKIEEAIAALQQEPTQEMLAHTLTVIRRRMQENGQFIVAVEPPAGDNQIKVQAIQTADGSNWWAAFTSFEEELKGGGSVKSTFLADIDKLFASALTVPEITGIIINPWNRTIQLDKNLIRIIEGAKR